MEQEFYLFSLGSYRHWYVNVKFGCTGSVPKQVLLLLRAKYIYVMKNE